jgi:hypothetical protein
MHLREPALVFECTGAEGLAFGVGKPFSEPRGQLPSLSYEVKPPALWSMLYPACSLLLYASNAARVLGPSRRSSVRFNRTMAGGAVLRAGFSFYFLAP